MNITPMEYFFYEWLIVVKKFDQDSYSKISEAERSKLLEEFNCIWNKIK